MAIGKSDRPAALWASDVRYIDFAVIGDTFWHIHCDCEAGTTGTRVVSCYLNIYLCGKYSILKCYLWHVIILLAVNVLAMHNA